MAQESTKAKFHKRGPALLPGRGGTGLIGNGGMERRSGKNNEARGRGGF